MGESFRFDLIPYPTVHPMPAPATGKHIFDDQSSHPAISRAWSASRNHMPLSTKSRSSSQQLLRGCTPSQVAHRSVSFQASLQQEWEIGHVIENPGTSAEADPAHAAAESGEKLLFHAPKDEAIEDCRQDGVVHLRSPVTTVLGRGPGRRRPSVSLHRVPHLLCWRARRRTPCTSSAPRHSRCGTL